MTGSQVPALKKMDFPLTFCQVISALAVTILHTNSCFWVFSSTRLYWFSANVIECIFYFAVPVFFMITGINLADYKDRYSTKTFFIKRAEKTLIPYIFWSVIALVFQISTGGLKPSDITPSWVARSLIRTDNIITYYWFFGALFIFYLLMPLIASIKKEHRDKAFRIMILVLFLCNILDFFVLRMLVTAPDLIDTIDIGLGNLIFIFLGYYIYKKPPVLLAKLLIYILAIAGLLVHMNGTYRLSNTCDHLNVLFKGYPNFPSVLYSLGMFILLRDIGALIEKIGWLKKFFEMLGKYSNEVFLLHWFIINITKLIVRLNPVSLVYRLLFPIVIYAVIIPITWFLRKIPGIRKAVP